RRDPESARRPAAIAHCATPAWRTRHRPGSRRVQTRERPVEAEPTQSTWKCYSPVERSFESRFDCLDGAYTMPESLPITTASHRPPPRHIRTDNGGVSAYLAALNAEQRRAVEYGVGLDELNEAGPLLIIAGAGSGKTNTLAYRVPHLVLRG